MIIRIKKHADGRASLTCTRPDGSATWQRQEGAQAGFFPRHDLTHYAVETTLGHRRGFYGLVAEGWDLGDFGAPWPRGPLPGDMDPSEQYVGYFDLERATGVPFTAADFNEKARQFHAEHGMAAPSLITDEDLDRIRATMLDLFARWAAVPPGESLELSFELPAVRPSPASRP
jgi:hypothetical protein